MSVAPLGLSGSYGIDADGVERAFHEHGVNYFFITSREDGVIEGIKRLVAAGHRDKIVIAGGASVPFGWSVRREWEKRARSVNVDVLDVFHLFWVQAHWYVTGKTWPAMAELKEQGKVRALSISCHDRPLARSLVDELSLDALMIRYNAAHRGAEREIFATLPEGKPAIVSYTATRWGKLLKAAGDLGPMTAGECYRFQLGNPRVSVALSGAGSYEQLRENVASVLEGPLPEARLVEVKKFGDAVRSTASSRLAFSGG